MTNNLKKRQLNLGKTNASVLTESTLSLKKKKYKNISLNKIRDMRLSAFGLLRQ